MTKEIVPIKLARETINTLEGSSHITKIIKQDLLRNSLEQVAIITNANPTTVIANKTKDTAVAVCYSGQLKVLLLYACNNDDEINALFQAKSRLRLSNIDWYETSNMQHIVNVLTKLEHYFPVTGCSITVPSATATQQKSNAVHTPTKQLGRNEQKPAVEKTVFFSNPVAKTEAPSKNQNDEKEALLKKETSESKPSSCCCIL